MQTLELLWLKEISVSVDTGWRACRFRRSDLKQRSRNSGLKKIGWFCMWVEKLFAGVLRVLTPLGARYIKLSMAQRIYLLWIFRHFHVLPLQVLTSRQRRMIDALCVEPRFVPLMDANGWEAPILGTLERRPPTVATPVSSNARSVDAVSPFAANLSNAERRS
jgi:hypothetical protein